MAWVQCKGCDCDDKTNLYNTLEGYCMDCAAKRVKGYDKLQAENKSYKEYVESDYKATVQLRNELDIAIAENKEQKRLIDEVCGQEPCPKCGYGVTAACYGCEIERLKEQLQRETNCIGCGEPIYHKSYCNRCRKQLES